MIRVVIVDDDPMVVNINQRYAEQVKGLKVEAVFQDSRNALEYIRKSEPDLVILDIYMPYMDGLTLLDAIRREDISSDVIMVTAANDMSQVDHALRLGIVDYLIKPFEFERFRAAIEKFLAKRNLLSQSVHVKQQMLDKLTSVRTPAPAEEMKKGIHPDTRQLISRYIWEHRDEMHTCENISNAVHLSKVTVRRYLNHMLETGELSSTICYETGGRPSILYQYNG